MPWERAGPAFLPPDAAQQRTGGPRRAPPKLPDPRNYNAPDLKQRFAYDHPSRLLSVDSRRVPIHRFGVVVVGSGVAGATAALAAAEAGIEVALLTKADAEESNKIGRAHV